MLSAENCRATLRSIVAASLAKSRSLSANDILEEIGSSDNLREGPAAIDSLERLSVAREVAEFFELHKAGSEEFLLRRSKLSEWVDLILKGYREGAPQSIGFRTGGTTGDPKLVSHPLTRLWEEADEIAGIVGGIKRVIALVPLHHIYGFIWGALLSDRLGIDLVYGPEAVQHAHQGLGKEDLLLGVPEWWRYLSQIQSAPYRQATGVCSTAPCPRETIQALIGGGLASMIEVYGSSETAGIGWRRDPSAPFQLFAHWKRVDSDHLQTSDGSRFSLPDHVEWIEEKTLLPLKRRDHAIQIGGVNVWPDRVSRIIESHPQVVACAVRTVKTGEGNRLKAFIVAADKPHDEALKSKLLEWIRNTLPAPERPIQLTFGEKLPRNALGKLNDW